MTQIDEISQVVSAVPPLMLTSEVVNIPEDEVAFNNAYEANNEHLVNNTVPELNALKTQFNTSVGQINTVAQEIQEIGENAINAITFNDIATLKLNSNMGRVDVLGYYAKGDGGGGTFYWDNTSTETDNGGTIIQATGVTTGRWKRVFSGAVNVKWFGAKGDGINDDTIAIRAAYVSITGIRVSSQSTVFDYTMSSLFIPFGRYIITGSITQSTGTADSATFLSVSGEDSIIIGGTGTFNFFEFRTGCSLSGLSFQGGGRAFYIQSGNTDSAKFNIDNCTFQNQTVESFGDDGLSPSSIVNITRCKIYQVNGGENYPRMATFNVDQLNIENNWIYYGGVGSPFHTKCDTFNFVYNLCVPNYLLAQNTQRSWFYNSGTINLEGNRFGAEGAGCTIVEHAGDYSAEGREMLVSATNNKIYSANQPAFKFYRLPSSIRIDNNSGYDLTPGIVEWGVDITESAIAKSLERGLFIITDITTREFQFAGATPMFNVLGSSSKNYNPQPLVSNLIISANTDLSTNNRIATSSGSVFYSIGGGRTGRRFEGPTDTLLTFYVNPTGQTEIEAVVAVGDWFTTIYYVYVLSNTPMSGYAKIGNKKEPVLLRPGINLLSYQLCRISGQTSNVVMTFGIKSADDIVIGPLRVFKGCCEQKDLSLEMLGTATPSSGIFFAGEKVIYTAPLSGGFIGQVCTGTGAPGTWKTFGAITA